MKYVRGSCETKVITCTRTSNLCNNNVQTQTSLFLMYDIDTCIWVEQGVDISLTSVRMGALGTSANRGGSIEPAVANVLVVIW